jgi:3' terminal RNA ribose 2'-O-methyltransferase Hen1
VLLTLTTTHQPATDLGYLLHKNPANVRTVDLPFGTAHVLYPEASDQRCTAALLVEVDPIGLVRKTKGKSEPSSLRQYVNDRPYAASSFLAVAIAKLFGSAMAGSGGDRPELVHTPLPLEAWLPVVPARGGADLLHRLFDPLGYEVTADPIPLDPTVPAWGDSRYFDVRLSAEVTVADLLTHLYVLLPVLDDDKHYWVGDDEVDKLLRRGEGWLPAHPERELITRRYLRHQRHLADDALERLLGDVELEEVASDDPGEEAVEAPLRLNDQRIDAVCEALAATGAQRVLDLGCGDGKLLKALVADRRFTEIVGVDVSARALEVAARRLHLDEQSERQRDRIRLVQSALTYRDQRLAGFDAAAVVEVVEHLDPGRLEAFEQALFGSARPGSVVLTTPNVEHNVRFETLPSGQLRHHDHRFEWTRAELREWAGGVAERHDYEVTFSGVGPDDPEVGPPTQMAVYTR